MAIEIIIEDGSVVPTANSYVTIEQFRAFAESQGVTLPSSDDSIASMLITSATFLDSYECKFPGVQTMPMVQPLCWPRSGVYYNKVPYADNAIPPKLKTAQMFAAIYVSKGGVLFPTQDGAAVKREKVGPIDTEYDTASWTGTNLPVISSVELALKPLFGSDCGFSFRTRRV